MKSQKKMKSQKNWHFKIFDFSLTFPKIFFELLLFSNSSEFFYLPHSFSSGSRVPRIPLRSLRIPLGVLVLHCGVRLRIPPVRRVIPEFRWLWNLSSGARPYIVFFAVPGEPGVTARGPEVSLWSFCESLAFFCSLGSPTRITHTSLTAQLGLCAEKKIVSPPPARSLPAPTPHR